MDNKLNYFGFHTTMDYYNHSMTYEELKRRELDFDELFACIVQHNDDWISVYMAWMTRCATIEPMSFYAITKTEDFVMPETKIGECWNFVELKEWRGARERNIYMGHVIRCYGRKLSHHRLGYFHPKRFAWIDYKPYGDWDSEWNNVVTSLSAYQLWSSQYSKLDTECLV